MASSMNYISVRDWMVMMTMTSANGLALWVSVPLYKIGVMVIITIITASKGPCKNVNKVVHVKYFALPQCLPPSSVQ